ncbi:unnamed protein product [Fusarium graminearum]|uniref:Uncharacterized protein n=1 Tax=Gibberella zeae TaxID=5518 RepID=A0A4E9EDS2_GIBZA|nr:unnamed protein product [Fusarium graminearum]CAF3471079.1 unnamed protein product [Fusarium graminearum]CAG1982568.1 unnamed protein product [Fusarium graminearum]
MASKRVARRIHHIVPFVDPNMHRAAMTGLCHPRPTHQYVPDRKIDLCVFDSCLCDNSTHDSTDTQQSTPFTPLVDIDNPTNEPFLHCKRIASAMREPLSRRVE